MMEIVPATKELFEKFGSVPEKTCVGLVVIDGEKVLGITGFWRETYRLVIFSEIKDELKKHPKIIMRTAKKLLAIAKQKNIPIHTGFDPTSATSERFIKHFGFKFERGVYICQ